MAKKKGKPKVTESLSPPAAEPSKRTRPVRIELPEDMYALLDRILDRCGNPSRAAYFRGLLLADARKRGLLKGREGED
jgi:hypothetical protein